MSRYIRTYYILSVELSNSESQLNYLFQVNGSSTTQVKFFEFFLQFLFFFYLSLNCFTILMIIIINNHNCFMLTDVVLVLDYKFEMQLF